MTFEQLTSRWEARVKHSDISSPSEGKYSIPSSPFPFPNSEFSLPHPHRKQSDPKLRFESIRQGKSATHPQNPFRNKRPTPNIPFGWVYSSQSRGTELGKTELTIARARKPTERSRFQCNSHQALLKCQQNLDASI